MVDERKELNNVTRELVAELVQMTVSEIKRMREEWIGELIANHISARTIHYVNALVNCVIEQKMQAA